jgi:hypothetical protein
MKIFLDDTREMKKLSDNAKFWIVVITALALATLSMFII